MAFGTASASSRPLMAAFDMAREEFRLMETPEKWAVPACRPASSRGARSEKDTHHPASRQAVRPRRRAAGGRRRRRVRGCGCSRTTPTQEAAGGSVEDRLLLRRRRCPRWTRWCLIFSRPLLDSCCGGGATRWHRWRRGDPAPARLRGGRVRTTFGARRGAAAGYCSRQLDAGNRSIRRAYRHAR